MWQISNIFTILLKKHVNIILSKSWRYILRQLLYYGPMSLVMKEKDRLILPGINL